MIIESKFVDYYDPLCRQFRDKSVIFKRHNDLITEKLPKDLPKGPRGYRVKTIEYLIFCGKLYPYIKIPGDYTGKYLGQEYGYESDDFSYSVDEVKEIIKSDYKLWNNLTQDKLVNAMNFDWTKFCLSHGTPIIRILPDNKFNVELNPVLKNIKFYKVFDSFQTYQSIYQFIGMQMTKPDKEPRPINDKLKAKNHGFDKFSFRKDTPPTRKQKIN